MDDLRKSLRSLLRDLAILDEEDENRIIANAIRQLDKTGMSKISEEQMIDAVFDVFSDEEDDVITPSQIEVRNPGDFDEILDSLCEASEDDIFVKEAIALREEARGGGKAQYDPKGKNYTNSKRTGNERLDEQEILDATHDDIEYHRDATKTPGKPRNRADMLARE